MKRHSRAPGRRRASTFVARIPAWFSTRRAAQVVAFFAHKAGGKINVLRATKLIYLADRESMARRDHPITGDNFVAMEWGPVNTYTYSLMKGEAEERHIKIWREFVARRAKHDIPLAREIVTDDLDELSRSDIRILEETWEKFEPIIDQYELAEWTHEYCPEWKSPGKTSIPIAFSTVFNKLEKDEPVELEAQIQAERVLAAHFSED